MINPQEQRLMKTLEALENLQVFTEEEMEMAENYLQGNSDEEILEKFPLRDLKKVPSESAAKVNLLFHEMESKGRMEDMERLSRLLFAVGMTSGKALFPPDISGNSRYLGDKVKRAAVWAAGMASKEWMLNKYNMNVLLKMLEKDPMELKQAWDYQYNTPEGEILILAAYFYVQYPAAKPKAVLTEEGEYKSLGVGSDDKELMARYEEIVTDSIESLFGDRIQGKDLDTLVEAVKNDHLEDALLAAVQKKSLMERYMLRILCGCAFVNFALSPVLRNIVRLCLYMDTEAALGAMDVLDLRGDLSGRGGNFDQIFHMDSMRYLKWAAEKGYKQVLNVQFKKNKEGYLTFMDSADFDTYNLMTSIVKEQDSELYGQRMKKELSRQQIRLVDAMADTVEPQVKNNVVDYLNGTTGIEALYEKEEELVYKSSRWGGEHWKLLENYQKTYGHDELVCRCETLLMLCRGYNYYYYVIKSSKVLERGIIRLFEGADSEKLALRCQLNTYEDMYEAMYSDSWKADLKNMCGKIFGKYLEERRDEMVTAIQKAGSTGRCFGLSLLAEKPQENKEVILGFGQDSAKSVKEVLLDILCGKKEWEEDILKLLSSKKAADRETAIRVLDKWGSAPYKDVLTQTLEKEKNNKVRGLLESVLKVEAVEAAGGAVSLDDLVKDMHKGNKKRGLAWAYETPFSKVHNKKGEEASEAYLQAVLLAYSSMSPCGISPTGAALARELDEKEFAHYVNELFDKWMEAGAESKKRWVLYAASIHGGPDIIRKLHHQIQEWPVAARGAIASEAVQALTLNPDPQALLIVDGISRKFKFKQVKAAAVKALEFAASQLGITTEELADRIVPDLGFNSKMERIFDYGERQFTVMITPALEIEVYDASGKKLKNLPAPGKKDDQDKAAAAYEEFKLMKKQMKATVTSQKMRLEMALSSGRQWSVESWKNLFVNNPIMHQFAIGLVWGLYEDHKLVTSFRYMEDGSFNTEDEDEFELPEGAQAENARTPDPQEGTVQSKIALVHPLELSEESLQTWKEQLEDYEITQPIEQLTRPVYYMTKEEENEKSLERFGGYVVNDLSLGGKLQSFGWYKGSVQDGGGIYSYYREDQELHMGVELHFSGSYVGGMNDDVTVYEVRFYNAGGTVVDENGNTVTSGIMRGSYVYDEADDSNSYLLKEVPERYFSEVVLQLTKALASSSDRIENWKKQKR